MSAVSVEALPEQESQRVADARRKRRYTAFGAFAVLAVVAVVVSHEVPSWLDLDIQKRAQDAYKWTINNRQTSPIFKYFFEPLKDLLQWMFDVTMNVLEFLRWPGVVALTGAIGWRTGGLRAGVAGAAAMLGVGMIADWDLAMITLAIMLVAVFIALVLGIPLGIWTSRSDRVEQVVRILLDTAQVLPIFVYFSPVQVLFSIQVPPAIVVTVIYALPPAVRLTNHGLRNVPVVMNEVGESFGANSRQQLFKVQLPVARRTILLGLNQVIMMAFGVVVLASLLGTGDLGQSVLTGLQKQNVGDAAAAGLGIVLLAIALDRITTGEHKHSFNRWAAMLPKVPARTARAIAVGIVVVAVALAHLFDWTEFPAWLTVDIAAPIDSAVEWVQDNLGDVTQAISDFLVTNVIDPIYQFLLRLPWFLVVVAIAFIGFMSKGWRLATGVGLCMVLIAAMGTIPGGGGREALWDIAMNTLSQVLVAIAISVAIALPLGIVAGRSDAFERVLRPFLDVAQVLPAFVYLIPVVFLFGIGRSAGVVACVIYAVPPCIRLTSLGMREVPHAPREAATSFGATGPQEMRMVQLPLARKSILLGINQTLMMVLATVIIAALIGAGGLGLVAYEATAKPNIKLGQGVAGGLSIVLLAIMLDRITQAWGTSKQGGNQ
ncbi:MAG: ABC transporter permease subunit [Actinobacteria bacterium]|nr:ABC transporter permease subunit [Actinomycetota bacterium]